MKRRIRLTENELHNVVNNSVKRILNELDWKTSDSAIEKSSKKFGEWCSSVAYFLDSAIDVIQYESELSDSEKEHFISKLMPIYNYFNRKKFYNQGWNLKDLHKDNFAKQHGGKTEDEFKDGIESKYNHDSFEYENLTPSEQEYVDYKY